MVNRKFELYKIKREIKRNGIPFVYWRFPKNQFGEVDKEKEPIYLCTIKGMYHEFTAHMTDTFIILSGTETATTRTKKTPQSLCEYDDVLFTNKDGESDSIKIGDYVYYNYRVMRVTGLQNIMEWNTLVDISFEEVDDGTDAYIRRKQESNKDKVGFDGCKISSKS